jgi:hypothetical protein
MFLVEPNGVEAPLQANDLHHFGIAEMSQTKNPGQFSLGQKPLQTRAHAEPREQFPEPGIYSIVLS